MEEPNSQIQLNQETSKKVPRIFTVIGEFVRQFGWVGYLLAIATVAVSLIVIFCDYKQISATDFPGYFITISAWFWLSIGFVKFSKSYAQSIQEGSRNAIVSFIFLAALFCLLAGFTAFYRYRTDSFVFGIAGLIFAASFLIVMLLISGLIFYWNRLQGGIKIYDE